MKLRKSTSTVKAGFDLRTRTDQAIKDYKYLKWFCVYHYHHRKGVLIGYEPPNDSWPKRGK